MQKFKDIVILYGIVPTVLYVLYTLKISNDHGYVEPNTFYWYAAIRIIYFIIISIYLVRKYK